MIRRLSELNDDCFCKQEKHDGPRVDDDDDDANDAAAVTAATAALGVHFDYHLIFVGIIFVMIRASSGLLL